MTQLCIICLVHKEEEETEKNLPLSEEKHKNALINPIQNAVPIYPYNRQCPQKVQKEFIATQLIQHEFNSSYK